MRVFITDLSLIVFVISFSILCYMSLCYVIYSSVISFIDRQLRVFLNGNSSKEYTINPFHATGHFLHPLKTLENLWFSYVFFRGYRNGPVAYNGLMQGFLQVSPHRQTLSRNKFLLYLLIFLMIWYVKLVPLRYFWFLLTTWCVFWTEIKTYRHWIAIGKIRFISSFKDTLNAFNDFKN